MAGSASSGGTGTLNVWGVLVLGPDAAAVTPAGEGSAASEAISATTDAVESASGEGRTAGLDDARQFLTDAREADSYGAYARAVTAAENALAAADAATEVPTVGIDTAHNQPDAGHSYDYFAEFRDAFLEPVEFTEVTGWSDAVLDELEVLVVPPTYEHQGGDFGFTDAEADLLEEFVSSGGGVAFLAQGGIARDHTVVTERFDVEFEPGPVRQPGEWGSDYRRRGSHALTRTVLRVGGGSPSAVVDPPDDATVLLEYPRDADLWRELCGDRERQDCDADAAGEPASVLLDRGNGTCWPTGACDTRNPRRGCRISKRRGPTDCPSCGTESYTWPTGQRERQDRSNVPTGTTTVRSVPRNFGG
ncbi:hypothetical protein BRD00_14995 [Halobacteriales archaeon QS_8_69_26]|nr:MAG: hypothetical protein BRD00_14995 [Halobacteriales archaeon QS_8_69_26]